MKILFTADWHIKLGQKNVPIEWQRNRYLLLFEKLEKLQLSADMMIIGGDIFDKLPSLEELELYFSFLPKVSIDTVIYDGNHEATKKGKTFLSKLEQVSYNINPRIKIVDSTTSYNKIDFIPYCDLHKITKIKNPTSKILCTHVRGAIPPHVKPEIDLSLLEPWDVVLAGDLHSYENSQLNIIYPGSPLSTSFHRNLIKNGVILFDTVTMKHEFIDLNLPQLIRKTVTSVDEALPTDYHHTIYEITGNVMDLLKVDVNSEFIDKKIVQKNSVKTLDLHNKTISEELVEYLTKIQKLDSKTVEDILHVYHDHIEAEG